MQFLYDVVCPYAYVASTQLPRIARAAAEPLEWSPVLLGGLFREIGAPDVPASVRSAARLRIERDDLLEQARDLGVTLRPHPNHPVRTVDAMRLCVAAPEEARPGLSAALFEAYHVHNRDVSSRDLLAGVAREHGVDPAAIDAPETKASLRERTAHAAARGVFGVPTVRVGSRMFWGADRLHLVRDALDQTRVPPPRPGDAPVTFFHDFSSPFSYLASTVVHNVSTRVEWVPILLGGLFRAIGTPDVPLATMTPPRRAYMIQDLRDHAAWHGVPFRFASAFPLHTVLALRVAIVEPASAAALYRAAWVEDRDIGDPGVLRRVLDDAGFDGAALVAAAADPAVKQRLRDNTDRAVAAGACGAPTFLVHPPHGGPPRLFWGQDRVDQAAAAARDASA